MVALPRTLDDAEKQEVLRYFHGPFGLRLLESLLDTRSEFMVQSVAREIADPTVTEDKVLDAVRPVRTEMERIEYAKEFLRAVYAASFRDGASGS